MKDINQTSFKYAGKSYTLVIQLMANDDVYTGFAVDNNDIRIFEYSTELNGLYVKGQLEYVDRFGNVDKIIDQQYNMCRVTFAEIDVQTDEGYSIETLTDGSNFTHDFFLL